MSYQAHRKRLPNVLTINTQLSQMQNLNKNWNRANKSFTLKQIVKFFISFSKIKS